MGGEKKECRCKKKFLKSSTSTINFLHLICKQCVEGEGYVLKEFVFNLLLLCHKLLKYNHVMIYRDKCIGIVTLKVLLANYFRYN